MSRKHGTPKKQRRVCKKGTKPNLGLGVPYDATLAIPGAKVVCRNGVIYTLTKEVEYLNDTYALESFNLINGKHYWGDQYDILRVIIEEDKPKQDHFNGYSAGDWHFWDEMTIDFNKYCVE